MVQVRFITFGASSAWGAFAPGDILRCSEETARHLVEEAKCAEYVHAKPAEADNTQATRRGRKAKE
jgi:hypothetical protein